MSKNYFVEWKLHSATLRKVLLEWDKCETKHDEQENSSTDDTLWFSSATELYECHTSAHVYTNEL